jgi:hypothetical protein
LTLPAVLALLAGCDNDHGRAPPVPSEPPPAPVTSIAHALGIDAGELEPSVDPPAPAGDLKAELDAFTTVDACAQQRARVDPLIGDALEAIGYDTFLRDACRVLDAAKARDPKRCQAIDASTLRGRCEATVAEIAGDPDACPWVLPTRRTLGRDAACVAIASRDARLCAGVGDSGARATCEAIVRHDAAPCAKLSLRADQARCARDVERWRTATPPADASAAAMAAPAGKLHVEGVGGSSAAPVDVDLGPDLAHGLVLVEQRDGARIVVGPLDDAGVGFVAATPQRRASLALELLAPTAGKDARIERAQLLLPGHLPLATPAASSTLTAKVAKLEHARGGAVTWTVDGDLGSPEATWHVHAEGSTFVRDVVKAAALYDAALPRFGIDAGMR